MIINLKRERSFYFIFFILIFFFKKLQFSFLDFVIKDHLLVSSNNKKIYVLIFKGKRLNFVYNIEAYLTVCLSCVAITFDRVYESNQRTIENERTRMCLLAIRLEEGFFFLPASMNSNHIHTHTHGANSPKIK